MRDIYYDSMVGRTEAANFLRDVRSRCENWRLDLLNCGISPIRRTVEGGGTPSRFEEIITSVVDPTKGHLTVIKREWQQRPVGEICMSFNMTKEKDHYFLYFFTTSDTLDALVAHYEMEEIR